MKAFIFITFLEFFKLAFSFCPAIFKRALIWDYCVQVTDDVPQNKTVYIDEWDGGRVCAYGGRPNSYIWPVTQVGLNSNSANYKNKFNNSGTDEFGYLEGHCRDPRELLGASKLHGEKWSNDIECLMGNWDSSTGRCSGLAAGEICTSDEQCQSGYYCNANIWTVVPLQGAACTGDNSCPIDMICAQGANTCEYLFNEVENVTARDPRMWISGVKRNTPGNNGEWRTTDYVQQNGVNLTNNQWDPSTANICELRSVADRLYPNGNYEDFTQMAISISDPTDCHCLYNTTGYCMPLGNDDWYNIHEYWRNNIVSKLKTYWHQSRRFNPIAWVDCQKDLDSEKLNYFVSEIFRLTTHVYGQNDRIYEFIKKANMYSDENWPKINSLAVNNYITWWILGIVTVFNSL